MATLTPTCLHDLTTIAIPRHARWDSDADILVVMPFEGSSLEQRLTMLELAAPSFPVDLLLCRPEAAVQVNGCVRELKDCQEQAGAGSLL